MFHYSCYKRESVILETKVPMNLNSLFAREKHKPSPGKEIPRQKPAFTYRAVTLVSGCLLAACAGDLSSHPSLSRAQQVVSTPRTSGVNCGEKERGTTGDLEVEAVGEGSTLQLAVLEVSYLNLEASFPPWEVMNARLRIWPAANTEGTPLGGVGGIKEGGIIYLLLLPTQKGQRDLGRVGGDRAKGKVGAEGQQLHVFPLNM